MKGMNWSGGSTSNTYASENYKRAIDTRKPNAWSVNSRKKSLIFVGSKNATTAKGNATKAIATWKSA